MITSLKVSHGKDELAEKVVINLVNIGAWYGTNIFALRDNVFVYADTGDGAKEVFRGFVWDVDFVNSVNSDEIKLVCYDRLIYLQKSKDNFFAKAGKDTADVISSIADKWGLEISYKYTSISHSKLAFHNESIADMLTEILDKVKKQTGVKYVIRMEGSTMVIEHVGANSTVYKLAKKENAISTSYRQTMDDMVTQVLIVKAETTKNSSGNDEETGQYLTVASVDRNKNTYGTLQEILTLSKDENIDDAKVEAEETLNEKSTPKTMIEVEATDIPWVKKGHQIHISTRNMNDYYIVKSIEHIAEDFTMYLEVEKL